MMLMPSVMLLRQASQSGPELLPPVRTISKYDHGREKPNETVHQRAVSPIASEESLPTRFSRRSDVLIDLNNSVEQAEMGPRQASSIQAPVDLSTKVVEDLINLMD